MQSTDLIIPTILLLPTVLITKHYFKHKLHKKIQILEKQLLSKDKLLLQNIRLASLGELLENITHQWRQPLAIINAVGFNIQHKYIAGDLDQKEVSTCVNEIEHHVEKLSTTIDNFSTLFQSSTAKSYFNLKESFTYVTNILQPQIYDANIQIKVTLLNREVYTYKSELMQVFMHILNNSIEILSCHKDKQNYIFATMQDKGKHISIQIYDNAKGIPQEYLNDIFEIDFSNKEFNGSGAGLYMCRKIIEDKLGGRVTVDNHAYIYKTKCYVGARFCIEIPKDR